MDLRLEMILTVYAEWLELVYIFLRGFIPLRKADDQCATLRTPFWRLRMCKGRRNGYPVLLLPSIHLRSREIFMARLKRIILYLLMFFVVYAVLLFVWRCGNGYRDL